MKGLFSGLTGLIFLFIHIHNAGWQPKVESGSTDFLAPLTATIWHITGELVLAIVISTVVTLIVSSVFGRWR